MKYYLLESHLNFIAVFPNPMNNGFKPLNSTIFFSSLTAKIMRTNIAVDKVWSYIKTQMFPSFTSSFGYDEKIPLVPLLSDNIKKKISLKL